MAVTAEALFNLCSRCQEGSGRQPVSDAVEVTGTVVDVSLRHDGTPVVLLAADSRGLCRLECRCLSEEVLLRAKPGSRARLRGVCRGLEDGVTALLELCELVEPGRRRPARATAPARTAPRCRETNLVSLCRFCGRTQPEAHRIVTIAGKTICDLCVGEYSHRLEEALSAR